MSIKDEVQKLENKNQIKSNSELQEDTHICLFVPTNCIKRYNTKCPAVNLMLELRLLKSRIKKFVKSRPQNHYLHSEGVCGHALEEGGNN